MSVRRYAAKRDGNETEIAKALRKAGCLVKFQTDYDLLVYRGGRLYMLEVKTKSGRLTASQRKLLDEGWPLQIVRSEDEALEAVGLKASEREVV